MPTRKSSKPCASILVLGDSHSKFWLGHESVGVNRRVFPTIAVNHLGARTAHNSSKLFDEAEFSRVITQSKAADIVVCSFGEIDCRAHIVRLAYENKTSIAQVADNTAARYLDFLREISSRLGKSVIAWGPPPSAPNGRPLLNPDLPVVGTIHERNFATVRFTAAVKAGVESIKGVEFATIIDELLTTCGDTRLDALFDGCHLSQAHMKASQRALISAAQRMNYTITDSLFDRSWPIQDEAVAKDISAGLLGSSSTLGRGLKQYVLGPKRPETAVFSTLPGSNQYYLLDLFGARPVRQVNLSLMEDGGDFCDVTNVLVSISGKNWTQLSCKDGAKDGVASYTPDSPTELARFIKVLRPENGVLTFKNMSVLGEAYNS